MAGVSLPVWRREDLCCVPGATRSEEHTSELQSLRHLVCRLLLEKKTVTMLPRIRAGLQHGSHADDRSEPHTCPRARRGPPRHTQDGLPRRHVLAPVFFFNDTATTEIYTLSLHDALPI